MKQILVILICFAVCACSKDEEAPSQRELLEIEKAKVNQDSLNKLLVGRWTAPLQFRDSVIYYFNNNFTFSKYEYDRSEETLYPRYANIPYFFIDAGFLHEGKKVYKLIHATEGQIVGPDGRTEYIFGMYCHLFYFDEESAFFSSFSAITDNPNHNSFIKDAYELNRTSK